MPETVEEETFKDCEFVLLRSRCLRTANGKRKSVQEISEFVRMRLDSEMGRGTAI